MRVVDLLLPRGSRRRALVARVAAPIRARLDARRRPHSVEEEQDTLKSSWADHDPEALDSYLVTGFQNPQVNAQSIIARHRLVQELFPDEDFSALNRAEMEHCVRATKAMHQRAADLGVTMGTYLDDAKRAEVLKVAEAIRPWQDEYERKWAAELDRRTAERPLSVLELACGSANDYRYFARYGLAHHLRYTGVDLNDKNIANARRRYPGVDFQVQNVLDLPYPDRSHDYVIVFDLFEHMSIEAMEQAIGEACRLARTGLILTFFSMADTPEHTVRPVRTYFWNILSSGRMRELIEGQFGPVEAIRIRDLIRTDFDYGRSYNTNAWTFFATRRAD